MKLLAQISWSDDLQGEVGFGKGNGLSALVALLGERCLSGAHICGLLASTRRRLRQTDLNHSLTCSIVDLKFVDSLVNAALSKKTTDGTIALPRAQQRVEDDIASGFCSKVAGISYINNNHYTFFVLNIEEAYLGYGDSFGGEIPPNIRAAFLWWIEHLIQRLRKKDLLPAPELWFRQLPISHQHAGDGTSCGILAVNALEHHLFPNDILLIDSRLKPVATRRMSAFADICQIHLDAVSVIHNA